MSKYAYRDANRTKIIYARDASKEGRGQRFYCPNPNCNAYMYVVNTNGTKINYFSANNSAYPHIPGCPFNRSSNFSLVEYDEKSFDFENALESLCVAGKSSSKIKTCNEQCSHTGIFNKPLSTISQIYSMCKSYSITSEYNNLCIGKMILDDRSEYMYNRGVFGYKIIEGISKAQGMLYDANLLTIKLYAPLTSHKFEFVLKFSDKMLFRHIKDMVYNNKEKTIIFAGNWGKSIEKPKYNSFCAHITSKKQVHLIVHNRDKTK